MMMIYRSYRQGTPRLRAVQVRRHANGHLDTLGGAGDRTSRPALPPELLPPLLSKYIVSGLFKDLWVVFPSTNHRGSHRQSDAEQYGGHGQCVVVPEQLTNFVFIILP